MAKAYFYPEPANILLSTGKSHVTMWNITDSDLQSRQGLFTRKIPRPKHVTCAAFAKNGEVLTGDSDGNVMVWRGVKVVRVLKGAHSGTVGDIKVMEDGSFVSGKKDLNTRYRVSKFVANMTFQQCHIEFDNEYDNESDKQ